MMRVLLDTNLLLRLCHPRTHEDLKSWFERLLQYVAHTPEGGIIVSAVADYEARRGYLNGLDRVADCTKGLTRLNELCALLGVEPLSNVALKDAASLWDQAQRGGYRTAAPDRVDWDVILAAQARELNATVVTSNFQHLARYGVDARDWDKVLIPQVES